MSCTLALLLLLLLLLIWALQAFMVGSGTRLVLTMDDSLKVAGQAQASMIKPAAIHTMVANRSFVNLIT